LVGVRVGVGAWPVGPWTMGVGWLVLVFVKFTSKIGFLIAGIGLVSFSPECLLQDTVFTTIVNSD
jgi:hypothetical protein